MSVGHGKIVVEGHTIGKHVLSAPFPYGIQYRTEGPSPLRKGVLHTRRRFRKLLPRDETVRLHLLQLLRKYTCGYAADPLEQLLETEWPVLSEHLAEDDGFPSALENGHSGIDRTVRPWVRHLMHTTVYDIQR